VLSLLRTILKGTTVSRVLYVEFFAAAVPSPIRPIPAGQRAIFFLQQGVSDYKLSDPVYPFLPAGPGGAISSGSPLDRVTVKLGEALGYSSSTDAEVNAALEALGTLDSELAGETLRKLLTTTSDQLQLRIASRLVARNDIAGLGLVGNALLHPKSLSNHTAANLAGSLAGLKDPKSIPMLKQLLKAQDQQITRSVAVALRQSGSADALVTALWVTGQQ
jgi:HEAT repeat protein